jgi:hypothetical protein
MSRTEKEGWMAARTKMHEQVDGLKLGVTSFEVRAKKIYKEAQLVAALIPAREFEDVYKAAPEMEYHHRFIQSLLTWVWYEVNENGVPLENLPEALQEFYKRYEEPFASYWM